MTIQELVDVVAIEGHAPVEPPDRAQGCRAAQIAEIDPAVTERLQPPHHVVQLGVQRLELDVERCFTGPQLVVSFLRGDNPALGLEQPQGEVVVAPAAHRLRLPPAPRKRS